MMQGDTRSGTCWLIHLQTEAKHLVDGYVTMGTGLEPEHNYSLNTVKERQEEHQPSGRKKSLLNIKDQNFPINFIQSP